MWWSKVYVEQGVCVRVGVCVEARVFMVVWSVFNGGSVHSVVWSVLVRECVR